MNQDHNTILAWIRLSRTPGIGPAVGERLLERFGGPAAIFDAGASELRRVEGVGTKLARAIDDNAILDRAKKDLDLCAAEGIEVLARDDPAYPRLLAEIPAPPLVLYIKGGLSDEDADAVAVVGCRNPDPYVESMSTSIGAGLAARKITVVSGMARGVDGITQRAAIKAGGRSIAVLGSGIDVVYPPEHGDLYEACVENGAVVSEFPPGTEVKPGNFPRRNRVISGLSLGVVMVQAMSERSGALITVRCAMEQGREVFAVPGNAGSRSGRAGNALIKDGAILVETADDVALHIRPLGEVALTSETGGKADEKTPSLPDDQARIYSLVPAPEEGTIGLDALARQAGMPAQQAASIVLELELAGLVRPLPGKRYVRMGER